MNFRLFGLLILVFSMPLNAAPGRAPAVEDFVGIEVAEPKATKGAQNVVLVNLEQDLKKIDASARNTEVKSPSAASGMGIVSILGIIFVLGLPMVSWLAVISHMRKRASTENASNIKVLEDYRKTREESSSRDKRKAG